MVDLGVFEQIALVLAVCVAAAGLATLLRQPVVVGVLVAGIAVGPAALDLVSAGSELDLLATVGTSLLLFVVGLKLDVRILRRLGTVAAAAGLGQVGFTALLGYLLAIALGFDTVDAAYLSLALTFSSTVIVVKLLTDKRELHTLHGRIALAILVVQDLVVIVAMLAITAVGDLGDLPGVPLAARVGEVVLRGLLLLAIAGVMGRVVAPRLTGLFERQGELLVLAVVTWSVLLASLSLELGFSAEVGAFLAGIALASTRYRDAVASRLGTLRDFVLVFFFVQLGTRVDASTLAEQWPAVVVLSLFVLLGNPLIVLTIMGALGYHRRVAFRTGLHIAQISEFSLILVALGVAQGHIGSDLLGVVTVIGAVTIAVSTELIHNAEALSRRLDPLLRLFDRGRPLQHGEPRAAEDRPEYVIVGVGRLGSAVLNDLRERGERVLGVDFDPRGIRRLHWDLPVVYGDADDPDLPDRLPLQATRWVIITVRELALGLHLVGALRAHGYRRGIAVAANDPAECDRLREAGADVTFRPLHLAAGPVLGAILDAEDPR